MNLVVKRCSVAATAVMTLAALVTGCGNSQNASTGDSSSTSSHGNGSSSSSKETLTMAFSGVYYPRAAINTVINKFEQKYPQYTVKTDFITNTSWGDYINKLETMISSGNGPDVSIMATEGARQLVDNNLALPLDTYMKQDPEAEGNPNDYPPALRNAFVINGHTYAFGDDWNSVVIHINTDMLKAAHLPMPPANWDLADFLKYAKALTGVTNGKQHYGFAIPNTWFGTEAWLYNNDAGILNSSMTQSTINSPQAEQVIQLFHDMIYKYHYSPVPSQMDQIQQLMSGQVAMICAGRWPLGEYVPAKFKAVNVQLLPTLKTNQPEFGIAGPMVLKSTKDPLAAYRLSMFMSSQFAQDQLLSYANTPSRLSVMKTQLPIGPVKNYKIFQQNAYDAKEEQAPANYSNLESLFNHSMSAIYSNQTPVNTALNQLAQQMDASFNGAP